MKIVFTPFAIALDILTSPIQNFLDDEDDDDCVRAGPGRHERQR